MRRREKTQCRGRMLQLWAVVWGRGARTRPANEALQVYPEVPWGEYDGLAFVCVYVCVHIVGLCECVCECMHIVVVCMCVLCVRVGMVPSAECVSVFLGAPAQDIDMQVLAIR